MKKNQFIRILAILLISILAFAMLPKEVLADEEQSDKQEQWNSGVYHVGDFCDLLSEDYLIQTNHDNDEHIVETGFDYVVLLVGQSSYGDSVFTEYLDYIYQKNSLGYGMNRDGICLGLDVDTESLSIRLFGRAWEVFSKEDIDLLTKTVRDSYQSNGYEGAISAFLSQAYEKVKGSGSLPLDTEKTYQAAFGTTTVSLTNEDSATLAMLDGQLLPSWYVLDPSTFTDFHNDENEPRLIDLANLLSPNEENEIKARLKQIRQETNQDVVIYTDVTSYGMDNELFAMDFYVYKGYGIGEGFDGLVLFINMDPDNREMVSASFGLTRTVFTEEMSSKLDDILYEHLVEKDYYGAFTKWTDGVENLLKYGSVEVPEWYKAFVAGEDMEPYRQVKLINEVGGIGSADQRRIEKTIDELSKKYDTDIVVFLSDRAESLSPKQGLYEDFPSDMDAEEERINRYLDIYWNACGYGFGEDHRGIIVGIFVDESSQYCIQVRAYGEGATGRAKTFTKDAEKRLESVTLTNLGAGNYGENINRYLSFLGRYLRFGFVPHSWFTRGFWALLCAIGGWITGFFVTEGAKKKNNVVREAVEADANLVQKSFQVHGAQDILLGVRVDRKYIEPSSDSGSSRSSSSSSHSTYSSHSSSSSGRSSSTSRRKF